MAGKKYLGAQVEAINLLSQSVKNATKISEQDLKKAITTQYITAFGSLQQVKFNREIVDLLNKEEDMLKKLTARKTFTARATTWFSWLL